MPNIRDLIKVVFPYQPANATWLRLAFLKLDRYRRLSIENLEAQFSTEIAIPIQK
jgi:hypothetical protein